MSGLFAPVVAAPPRAGRYGVLYPDPPWPETGGGQVKRGADKHYDTMRVEDIIDLFRAFGTWAAADAHMYLWATNNYLPAAFECLIAAEFRYITLTTWVKDRPGLGQYFRGKTEHCLFAVRGRLPYRINDETGKRAQGETVFFEPPADLPEAFEATHPRGADGKIIHSRKPEKMRRYIELVSGDVPRVEMFARIATKGFDRWGLEAPE